MSMGLVIGDKKFDAVLPLFTVCSAKEMIHPNIPSVKSRSEHDMSMILSHFWPKRKLKRPNLIRKSASAKNLIGQSA
jgi:hypothetical protein